MKWMGGGGNRKTWKECVDDDLKVLGLHFLNGRYSGIQLYVGDFIIMNKRALAERGKNGRFQNKR